MITETDLPSYKQSVRTFIEMAQDAKNATQASEHLKDAQRLLNYPLIRKLEANQNTYGNDRQSLDFERGQYWFLLGKFAKESRLYYPKSYFSEANKAFRQAQALEPEGSLDWQLSKAYLMLGQYEMGLNVSSQDLDMAHWRIENFYIATIEDRSYRLERYLAEIKGILDIVKCKGVERFVVASFHKAKKALFGKRRVFSNSEITKLDI